MFLYTGVTNLVTSFVCRFKSFSVTCAVLAGEEHAVTAAVTQVPLGPWGELPALAKNLKTY
jgi:hypothetical protein